MSMFMGFFGVILLVVVIVGWYWLYRRMKGEVGPLFGRSNKEPERDSASELEVFIAAYRSGKVNPAASQGPAGANPAPSPVAPALPPQTRPPAMETQSSPRTESASSPLLRPEVKLAYLTIRAGLRDHHVFPNVRLSDIARGAAAGKVDLLVCDPKFQVVAAIDVLAAGNEADASKAAFLREAGIRYLKFSIGSMPKPADVHTLIYRA